jgi:hypothetical protein
VGCDTIVAISGKRTKSAMMRPTASDDSFGSRLLEVVRMGLAIGGRWE